MSKALEEFVRKLTEFCEQRGLFGEDAHLAMFRENRERQIAEEEEWLRIHGRTPDPDEERDEDLPF